MGQRETAAPMFSGLFDHPRQPANASNRHRLSAVCQSNKSRSRQDVGDRQVRCQLQPALVLAVPNTGSNPRKDLTHFG